MDPTYPAATFIATRDGLLGTEPLRTSAEIARGVCRAAERTVSVSAITATRIRRIDGWLGAVGFVTHAAATESGSRSLGSVCDRDRASELIRQIVGSLVGGVPACAAAGSFEMPALRSPASLPVGVDWVALVTVASERRVPRRLVLAAANGLVAADVIVRERSVRPVRLDPIEPAGLEAWLVEALAIAPRSVRDLLLDD